MTAPEQPSRVEVEGKIRELLGRATLARARGQTERALKLVQEAVTLDDRNAEALEFKGDLLLDLKRGEEAMASFRRARELRPGRVLLEDKIARAALQRAARRRTVEFSQAILEGKAGPGRPKRNPGYAALLSLILPGLGQIYNGEVLKGAVLITACIFLLAIVVLALVGGMAAGGGFLSGREINIGALLSAASRGSNGAAGLVLMVLWVYAIGDAAWRASKSMTSDETGLV